MGTKDVRIDASLNKAVWSHGIKKVPHRLRLRLDRKRNDEEDAKEKLSGKCAGGSCKAIVQFVPHSYTTSGVIEPGKSVTVFNAEKAKVRF